MSKNVKCFPTTTMKRPPSIFEVSKQGILSAKRNPAMWRSHSCAHASTDRLDSNGSFGCPTCPALIQLDTDLNWESERLPVPKTATQGRLETLPGNTQAQCICSEHSNCKIYSNKTGFTEQTVCSPESASCPTRRQRVSDWPAHDCYYCHFS